MTLKVCIHGHFYQPPREDPWTGMLPNQPSAAPFHDWNQRIQDECYRPNCRAMILDEGGDVASRCNTYRHISFNFGPHYCAGCASTTPAATTTSCGPTAKP